MFTKNLQRRNVFCKFRRDADCIITYYNFADYDSCKQCCIIFGDGGRFVDRTLPYRHQGTNGYRFLFWAIAIGIVLAAGLIPLAVFGSIFIGAVLIVFAKKKTVDSPYILVIHCNSNEIEENTRIFVKSQVKRLNLKSKSIENGCIELNYEVRLKEDNSSFVNELEAMQGISRVVLVSYNGDYMG